LGWLKERSETAGPSEKTSSPSGLKFNFLASLSADEALLSVRPPSGSNDAIILRERHRLTQREAEVLRWLARGKSNRDIAEILGVSARTVDKYLEQIYSKLGVENRTSAAAIALSTLNSADF
jgi:DNA-binding CsgD family transcriptional regulator